MTAPSSRRAVGVSAATAFVLGTSALAVLASAHAGPFSRAATEARAAAAPVGGPALDLRSLLGPPPVATAAPAPPAAEAPGPVLAAAPPPPASAATTAPPAVPPAAPPAAPATPWPSASPRPSSSPWSDDGGSGGGDG